MKRRIVPRGLEILLKKAKVDPTFRSLLQADPEAAAASIDLILTDSERSILANVPPEGLRTMIDKAFVPRQHVSTFLTQSAAAMLAVVLSTTVIVETHAGTGVTPEMEMAVEEIAADDLCLLQTALEAYRLEYGRYPTTREWYLDENPLKDLIEPHRLFDFEGDRFRYRGEVAGEVVVGYRLGTVNAEHVDCPDNPEIHRFVGSNRIRITAPLRELPLWASVRLPLEEGETAAPITFRTEHDDPLAVVTWYWDRKLIGSTRVAHEIRPVVVVGSHELFVVDGDGYADYLRVQVEGE